MHRTIELEQKLGEIIEEQRRAEEEQASRELLRTIQRAFREALLALPAEEYDWFDIQVRSARPTPGPAEGESAPLSSNGIEDSLPGAAEPERHEDKQRQFFEFSGPLFSVTISPHPVSFASAQAAIFVRCRAIVPGAAWNRTWNFIGKL